MKKHLKMFMIVGMAIMCGNVISQDAYNPRYIQRTGEGESSLELYKSWVPGQPLSKLNEKDEQFYISRTKPRTRFVNVATQVDESLDPDRKMLWWCPINRSTTNALPGFDFDSEAFSMWQFLAHYGNWSASMTKTPGVFQDVAHKNGVGSSPVASVPWAYNVNLSNNWGKFFDALTGEGAEKWIKFNRYCGSDGYGVNSEFNFTPELNIKWRNFNREAFIKGEELGWKYNQVWYNLMTSAGRVGGTYNTLNSTNDKNFEDNGVITNYFFLNYGSKASSFQTAQTRAEQLDRESYDIYGGMDLQASGSFAFRDLMKYKISFGVWGGHGQNMLFEGRVENGSTPDVKQQTYLDRCNYFFGGGTGNPVTAPPVIDKIYRNRTNGPKSFGINSIIAAQSTLQGDLSETPFVSYFNLGNGKYFNIDGERASDQQWYNIGMQDFLPTWRYWFSTEFLGREPSTVKADGLKAKLTWEDAWFGGSCLQVEGQTDGEVLHLFKTKYNVQDGDVLSIRYKVVTGTGNVKWACSIEGDEGTEINSRAFVKATTSKGQWQEAIVSIGGGYTDLKIDGDVLALLGLRFTDTSSDFKVNIGEISLTRDEMMTPVAPIIKNDFCEVMALNYRGYDFKMTYSMDEVNHNAWETVYNEDVDTWFFKIYSKQEGEDPKFCTATTSWAAYNVSAPYNFEGSDKVQIGVSSVSLDGKTESEIVWSNVLTVPEPSVIEDVIFNKTIIKVNETFEAKFKDFNHDPAIKFEVVSGETGEVLVSTTNATNIIASLPEEGVYDLRVTKPNPEEGGEDIVVLYNGVIQITSSAVGALPLIHSLTANDSEFPIDIKVNETLTMEYTSRNAEGTASRGVVVKEEPFVIPMNQLNFENQTNYSISFWAKARTDMHQKDGTQLVHIRDNNEKWPSDNWGLFRSTINKNNNIGGNMSFVVKPEMHKYHEDYKLQHNVWSHYCITFTRNGTYNGYKMYLNGLLFKHQEPGTNKMSQRRYSTIEIGGTAHARSGIVGAFDEVQLYNKELTQEEVLRSMAHFNADEIPTSLIGYWDFETDPGEDGFLMSTGSDTSIKAIVARIIQDKTKFNVEEVKFDKVPNTFSTGSPFIPGSFNVVTDAQWGLSGADVLTPAANTSTAGSIGVKYVEEGKKDITLTLKNGWGEDSKTFSYVRVDLSTGIDETDVLSATVFPNPFVEQVNVQFAESGEYTINLFNVTGKSIYSKEVSAQSDQFVTININQPKGYYLVQITKDGKILKTVKVLKQ